MCGKCAGYTPIDCQEIKFPASEKTLLLERWKKKKIVHCSRRDEDFHDSRSRVDPVSHDVTGFPVHVLVCH